MRKLQDSTNHIYFDEWNEVKKNLSKKDKIVLFREGEVWWIKMGINIGIEQNGKGDDFTRPVLVLKKYNRHHCLVAPLTTRKSLSNFSFRLDLKIGFLKKESWIIFSQVRAIDSKRLFERMGKLPTFVFEDIIKDANNKILPAKNTSPALQGRDQVPKGK